MRQLCHCQLFADDDDVKHNQPCVHGTLVDGHAVYCHNTTWKDAPRKCRRTWYTGGEVKDEDCPGFSSNPEYVPKEPKCPAPN